MQALNKKPKLMEGTATCFLKKLLGHENFSSLVLWAAKHFLKLSVLPLLAT